MSPTHIADRPSVTQVADYCNTIGTRFLRLIRCFFQSPYVLTVCRCGCSCGNEERCSLSEMDSLMYKNLVCEGASRDRHLIVSVQSTCAHTGRMLFTGIMEWQSRYLEFSRVCTRAATRSSATAERQRVSYTRLSRLTHWSCISLSTASVLLQLYNRLAKLVSTLSAGA